MKVSWIQEEEVAEFLEHLSKDIEDEEDDYQNE